MRNKKRGETAKNNLVILCEGSDTEYYYFTDAKQYVEVKAPDRFTVIKIVPVNSEKIKTKNPKRKGRKKLRPDTEGRFHYWCLYEHSEADYNLYKAQPTRYVRETQLYLENEGFTEGWVVFDKDVHPDHKHAFKLAENVPNLHIAFSSYCFEEWLLMHFERNPFPYNCSQCMIDANNERICGTGVENDCHGNICLAGRLREKNYICDYSKNKKNIFTEYTLLRLKTAFMNAGWLRMLNSKDDIYKKNPYTDIDILIARLLDYQELYEWKNRNIAFKYASTLLYVSVVEDRMIIYNHGTISWMINSDNLLFCDKEGGKVALVVIANSILEANTSKEYTIPEGASILQFKEGGHHLLIELFC